MGLDIRYARSGGVSIAYQVVGDGDVDLVYVPDYVSNLVYAWEVPPLASVLRAPFPALPADPLRQARNRALGPGWTVPSARDADG